MASASSRSNFYQSHPGAKSWAALDEATNLQKKLLPGPICLKKDQFKGMRAIVLGAGVAGLTTAYELLSRKTAMHVTVLEAQTRTGGRCLSLRTGDTLTEDSNSDLFGSEPGETQVVRFKQPLGDGKPYLNAGPGRIPSAHIRLLGYLKHFGVAVEVYIMNTMSNLVQKEGSFGGEAKVYRQLDHNMRGWISQMVYGKAHELLCLPEFDISNKDLCDRVQQLRSLMVEFGQLSKNGNYIQSAGRPGFEEFKSRAGFKELPGVLPGETAKAIQLDKLLESRFWEGTRIYQPVDFLWQPTLFQPVGGMDMVQRSFARKVSELGGCILLNHPVKLVDWDEHKGEFVVYVYRMGTQEVLEFRADYCFSSIAIPFLKNIISGRLQNPESPIGLAKEFKQGLFAVYKSQFDPNHRSSNHGFTQRFLAMTTKVGWQGERSLWQGCDFEDKLDEKTGEHVTSVPDSQKGVVPIFGGISWTDHPIAQIWYPSNDYQDRLGVLTGAYNFQKEAFEFGLTSIEKRLETAREGARRFGKRFGDGMKDGVSIAWQNMPYIKGGWAQWFVVDEAVRHFNQLTQGSSVTSANGTSKGPVFFIIGCQMSSLPGWQEGAIASALMALSRLSRPDLYVPYLSTLPDTRLMVEGV